MTHANTTKRNEAYFVRFFNEINASFPHAAHSLYNGARDATPPYQFNYCLLSNMPTQLPHLILLEFGSMARYAKPVQTEVLVRRLLELPTRPALLFVTVREWCPAAHLGFGHDNDVGDYDVDQPNSRMVQAELAYEKFCRLYNQSCISYLKALAPPHLARKPNFARADIAGDCLHPHKSRFGATYLGDMLWYWLHTVVTRKAGRGDNSWQPQPLALPPPVYGARAQQVAANMSFGAQFCYNVPGRPEDRTRNPSTGHEEKWPSHVCFAFRPGSLTTRPTWVARQAKYAMRHGKRRAVP